MRGKTFPVAALAAVLISVCAFPQSGSPTAGERLNRPAVVLVAALPAPEVDVSGVEDVVLETVRLELERAGLEAVVGPDRLPADEASLPEAVRAGEADFAVLARLSGSDRAVAIELSWYGSEPFRRISREVLHGKVDLSLDRLIAASIRQVLEREAQELARYRRAAAAGETGAPESAGPAAGKEVRRVPASSPPGREGNLPGRGGATPGLPAPGGVPPTGRFELCAGSAMFLTVGAAAGYFKLGFFPSISAAYALRLPSALLEIGLSAGVNLFQAVGSQAYADSLLLPVGLDLRYIGAPSFPLSPFLRLGGGPALLGMNPNGTGMLYKPIPYLLGGIGLYARLFGKAGIVVDSTYTVFFEGPSPIMGYAPGLSIYLRL